jgi:hypothetical protein
LELQRERNLVEDDSREGNHQEENSPRKKHGAKKSPTAKINDQAGEQKQQRSAREKIFGTHNTQDQLSECSGNNNEASALRSGWLFCQTAPLFPNYQASEYRDKKGIGVVCVTPPLTNKACENTVIQKPDENC